MRAIIRTESIEVINALKAYDVDFVLVEPFFSYHHPHTQSLDQFRELIEAIGDKNWYLEINGYIEDSQLSALKETLKVFELFKPKGVLFADFAVYEYLKEIEFSGEKVFAPETILTSSADIGFYLNYVDRCVLAKELTLDEMCEISSKYPQQIDVFGLGYALMSVSKRPLVQNYFNELNRDDKILNRTDLMMQEEKRPEWMPILEEHLACSTYMPDITYSKDEMSAFEKAEVHSLYCDSLFIEDEDFIEMVKALFDLENDMNIEYLKDKYPFGSAYYYRKTNLLKGEKS